MINNNASQEGMDEVCKRLNVMLIDAAKSTGAYREKRVKKPGGRSPESHGLKMTIKTRTEYLKQKRKLRSHINDNASSDVDSKKLQFTI